MAKPICVVYYNGDNDILGHLSNHEINQGLMKIFPDYHVLAVPSYKKDAEVIDIKVFYEKDFTEIQYAELKQLIIDSLQKTEST